MSHYDADEHLSPGEKKFRECVELGDNFMKIEIYYLADRWYERAVQLKPDDMIVRQKWDECHRLHRLENKAIYAVVGAMALIVLVVLGVLTQRTDMP